VVLGIAALVLVLAAVSGGEPAADDQGRGLNGWAVAILVAASAALLGSRRFPAAVAALVLALTFTWYAVGFELGLVNAWAVVAYHRLGTSHGQGRKVAVVAASVALSLVNIDIIGGEGLGPALDRLLPQVLVEPDPTPTPAPAPVTAGLHRTPTLESTGSGSTGR
jgi:hypothetical protein